MFLKGWLNVPHIGSECSLNGSWTLCKVSLRLGAKKEEEAPEKSAGLLVRLSLPPQCSPNGPGMLPRCSPNVPWNLP